MLKDAIFSSLLIGGRDRGSPPHSTNPAARGAGNQDRPAAPISDAQPPASALKPVPSVSTTYPL